MLNLAFRFVLELAGLAAIGFTAFVAAGGGAAGMVAALAAAMLFALAWGRIAAPRAANRLGLRSRQLAGSAMLLAAAVGLAWAGMPQAALAFALAVVANQLLLILRPSDPALFTDRRPGAHAWGPAPRRPR